jgi:beta-glucosidase
MNRIDSLIGRMTLSEKLGQLTMTAAGHAVTGPVIAGASLDAIRDGTIGNLLNLIGAEHIHAMQRIAVEESRLGIPLLIGLDVIHGHRTLFPVGLAEACVLDPVVWERTAREAAVEAAADGLAMVFAPMVDVARDPRWGRSCEGPGEDPWVAQGVATAKVRGFQGDDLAAADAVAACAKHFCAYGAVQAGREYATTDISERTLHEVHLPAFTAAVRAGVAAIMPAFTDIGGLPMTAHRPLLHDWLRGRMGFSGVLVSDYNAIGELLRHGVAADLSAASALALKAGIDIDMMANAYQRGLPAALERGLVAIGEIDAAVSRVLRLKERLGLFDDPYRRGSRRESADTLQHRRALARAVAGRSAVLLKNDGTLPLAAGVRRIALIGPLADAAAEMRGPWWAAADETSSVTVLGGLRSVLPQLKVVHVAGGSLTGEGDEAERAAAVTACDGVDAVVLCVGEAATMSGEAASRASLDLPGEQPQLARAVIERARARRIPVTVVLFSGRPLVVPWLVEAADAVLAAWFLGTEAGCAVADILGGRVSPSGRTCVSWPRALGQVPIFFGQRPTGRPADPNDFFTSKYLDVPNEPLFPFGHGLTYGRCALSNLRVQPPEITRDDTLEVSVDVINEGERAAEETVFLFSRDPVASVTRPLLELRAVGKIGLRSGERGTLTLQLPAVELRLLDGRLDPVFEPGEVEILVGPCAERTRLLVTRVQLRPGL